MSKRPEWRAIAPYLFLIFSVAVFYRIVLFTSNGFIPFDLPGFHLPPAVLETEAVRNGALPLWDPYTYCGFPLASHIALQVFYPFRIVSVLIGAFVPRHVDVLRILEWELILHVTLAAVFAFWLGRRIGLAQAPALLSGATFSLGCYFASQAEHIGGIETAAWLPLCWLCVLLLAAAPSFARVALTGGVFALVWLSGFPPSALIVFMSSALLAALLIITGQARPRLLLSLAGALVLSLGFAAIQLIPTAQLAALSLGSGRASWRGTGGGLPAEVLGTLFWPDYLHVFDLAKFDPRYELTLSYLYCGLAPLALAAAGMARRRSKTKFALMTMLFVSGVWMFGDTTVIGKYLYLALPAAISGVLYPQHWMAPFSLSLALLAGFGLQQLARLGRWNYAIVAVAMADLIAAGSGRPMNTARWDPESIGLDSAIDGEKTELAALRKASADLHPPPRLDVVNDSANWAAGAPLTGIPSPSGFNSLALTRLAMARLQTTGNVMWAYAPVVDVTSRMLDFLNVRFILTTTAIDPAVLGRSGLRLFGKFPGRYVYENQKYLPRFFMATQLTPAAGAQDALKKVTSPAWNAADEAVVEGIDVAEAVSGGTVRVIEYAPTRVVLETSGPRAGFLVTSEAHYPGWRVWIDGTEAPILYTNVAFRGVRLPSGKHTVEFRFRPAIFVYSGLISAASLLAVGLTIAALRRRSTASEKRA